MKIPKPRPGQPSHYSNQFIHVEVHLIGIGAIRLPQLSDARPFDGLIMAGLAGALDPSLQVGDIVIDDCPPAYLPNLPHHAGRIIVAPAIVATPHDKQALFEQTHALAVDMESEAARDFARGLNVPFISLRAISDTAHETLHPAVINMVNAFGQPRPLSIATALLRQPSLIPQLTQLKKNADYASQQLAAAVASIIERITENQSQAQR